MPEWPAELSSRVEALAAEHHLRTATLARWRDLESGDAEALADLATALRLGENHLLDFLAWAEEISWRDGIGVAAVLTSEPVRAARERDLGRNDSIKAVREALRRLRFPRLTAAEDDLARQVRNLRLPPGVRLLLPHNLQDTEIRVEIRAADAAAFRAAVDSLRAAVQRPEFATLFASMNRPQGTEDE